MVVPGGDVVRVAVKRSAIAAFWLKEDHRVVGFNGAREQAFGVSRVGAVHHFQAGRVGELRFGRLGMVVAAFDASTCRCSEGDRR